MGRTYFGIFILLTFGIFSPPLQVFAGESIEASLAQARRYGEERKLDFAFLELRDLLRRYPKGSHVPEVKFALAEYLFLQGNFREAKETFSTSLGKIEFDSTPRLLGQVFLLKCQEKLSGPADESTRTLLSQLKKELSSHHFFVAFNDKRTISWQSPLGNLYVLDEFVDRLEIMQNGNPFYTISLP